MWETNYAERLNYLNPLLFFSFKKLNDANSSSFIRFDWILHDSAVPFSYFENFLKFKRGDLISWGKPILQNGWIIWSSLLYFSLKKLNNPNSSSFMRFDWILHDSAVLFWYFENFHKFKKGDLIYSGELIMQNGWIIWSPFSISILKSWTTRILRRTWDPSDCSDFRIFKKVYRMFFIQGFYQHLQEGGRKSI